MSLVLLADDSPHAQRMGERILREEGFDVLTAVDGAGALGLLESQLPDVLVADVFLPGVSGLELCRQLKANPKLGHTRVVLTAGMLETFDEHEGRAAGADAILRKPFEATAVVDTLKPLAEAANFARGLFGEAAPRPSTSGPPAQNAAAGHLTGEPAAVAIDPERVRAAITVALDRALPALIEEITERVLIALGH
jgi:CheY-like chemotaxis protein